MLLDVIGERIEGAIDLCIMALISCSYPKPHQNRAAEPARSEQAVQIAAMHASICGHRTFALAVDTREGPLAVFSLGAPDVDFIGVNRQQSIRMYGRDTREALFRCHHGGDIEKAKALGAAGGSFDAVGISDALAEHLVA